MTRHAQPFAFAAIFALLPLLGCKEQTRTPFVNVPAPCASGATCAGLPGGSSSGTSSSSSTSGSSGGGGGSSVGVDVSGVVKVVSASDFKSTQGYAAAATVMALAPDGSTVEAPFGGTAGSTFKLHGVEPSPQWIFTRDDTNGVTGVLSAYSQVDLGSGTSIVALLVDEPMLQAIASNAGTTLQVGVAQVVIRVRRMNKPLAGVKVTGSVDGASVLYDVSDVVYSPQAVSTGTHGTIVLINKLAPAIGGQTTISIVDDMNTPIDLDIPVAPNAVTLATFDI